MNNQGGLTSEVALSQAVSDALSADAATARYPIDVAAQGTTVTLTGRVESQADKEEVERVARSVTGVIGVINELVVQEGGGIGVLAGDQGRSDAGTGAKGTITVPVVGGGAFAGGQHGVGAGFGAPLVAGLDSDAVAPDESAVDRADGENARG